MASRREMGRVLSAGLVVAAMGAIVAPAPAGAVPPQPGVTVVGAGDANRLATFRSASCGMTSRGFYANSSAAGWLLQVRIGHFTGFHIYDLRRGISTSGGFLVNPPGPGPVYGNIYTVDAPLPPIGGAITFRGSRYVMGLGFINAFRSDSNEEAVTLAGRLVCHYPPPPRRR